jgi:two-component system, OmpR family, response regulator
MKSLLFIEDNELQRELTTRLYQMCAKCFHGDVTFLTAHSWESGMKLVEEVHPDVILLDLVMPPFGRYETLQKVKETPGLPPVMVLTNVEEDNAFREEAFGYGIDDYMTKGDANHHPEELCERAFHCYLRRKRDDEKRS